MGLLGHNPRFDFAQIVRLSGTIKACKTNCARSPDRPPRRAPAEKGEPRVGGDGGGRQADGSVASFGSAENHWNRTGLELSDQKKPCGRPAGSYSRHSRSWPGFAKQKKIFVWSIVKSGRRFGDDPAERWLPLAPTRRHALENCRDSVPWRRRFQWKCPGRPGGTSRCTGWTKSRFLRFKTICGGACGGFPRPHHVEGPAPRIFSSRSGARN